MNTRKVIVKEGQIKRACLLFDNVIVHYLPDEFGWHHEGKPIDIGQEMNHRLRPQSKGYSKKQFDRSAQEFADFYKNSDYWGSIVDKNIDQAKLNGVELGLMHSGERFLRDCDYMDTCVIFDFEKDGNETVVESKSTIFTACLNSVEIVIEDQLDWTNLWEFRSDKESLRKYRKLHRWLDTSLKATSVTEAEDLIWENMERYSLALKKHGIKTLDGALKNIFSKETFVSTASGLVLSALFEQEMAGFVVAGGFVSAKFALEIADYITERKQIGLGAHSDLAYIYELNRIA